MKVSKHLAISVRALVLAVVFLSGFFCNSARANEQCIKVEQDCKFFGPVVIFIEENHVVVKSDKLGWTLDINKLSKKVIIANQKSKRRYENSLAKFSFAPIVSSIGNTDLETRREPWKFTGKASLLGKDVKLYRSMFVSTYRNEKGLVFKPTPYSRPALIQLITHNPSVAAELTSVLNRLFGLPDLPGFCVSCLVGDGGPNARDYIVTTRKITPVLRMPKPVDATSYLRVKNSEDVLVDSSNEALDMFR